MLSRKNIFLTAIFAFIIHSIFASQPTENSWYNWFKSFLVTPQKQSKPTKFALAVERSTALDFYKQKEQKHNQKKIQEIARNAAEKFKTAVQENNSTMKLLHNNPQKFLFGASSSSYQYEGGLDNNNANAVFYKNKGLETAEIAIDFWNRYTTDIKQLKTELGINSLRLSIAWERVQPSKDVWDSSAIEKYVDIIKTLKENNIEPIIVLHHYTIPQWFAEHDGFEKYGNIRYFVEFTKKIYAALHEHVTYWSTFNAIEGYAFKGYYTLDGPPGKQKSLLKTQEVIYNMLAAHAGAYKAIKQLHKQFVVANKNIPYPQVGIQKNIVLLDPADQRFSTRFITTFGSVLQNKMILSLLYNRYYNELDWIGVNIYSNMFLIGTVRQQEQEEERQTANLNYRDYPEGIYRAVKIINNAIARPLNIPIIITENGIATKNDTAGHEKRTRFLRRALYTIRKLIQEGYPIIGYTPWASHDNYEWPSQSQSDPYDRPYGMFEVNFDKNSPDYMKRSLKKGAEYYRDFINSYFHEPII